MEKTVVTKITKHDYFEMLQDLIGLAEEAGFEGFDYKALNDFCINEIGQLERKAAKAKERAAKAKTEADGLKDMVYEALSNEPKTKDEVIARVQELYPDEPLATSGRIVTRLTALQNDGLVEKESVTVGEPGARRKVMTYKLSSPM